MKLDRLVSGACAALAVAALLACGGCSSATSRAPSRAAQEAAALDGRTATTELMSAQLAGPAPRVGKAHLAGDDAASDAADELNAPKDARPSDGSRRAGHFGTTK